MTPRISYLFLKPSFDPQSRYLEVEFLLPSGFVLDFEVIPMGYETQGEVLPLPLFATKVMQISWPHRREIMRSCFFKSKRPVEVHVGGLFVGEP